MIRKICAQVNREEYVQRETHKQAEAQNIKNKTNIESRLKKCRINFKNYE